MKILTRLSRRSGDRGQGGPLEALGALAVIAGLLGWGYTASRTVHSSMMAENVSERAAGLDDLAGQARSRAARIRSRSGSAPSRANDPAMASAFDALAAHYSQQASIVRAEARGDYLEVRGRARPDPVRFGVGYLTGLPLDDMVFIAGDYSAAYGSGAMNEERERVARVDPHPSTIHDRVRNAAAGARLRNSYEALVRENPGYRGIPFNDPRIFALVQNRARHDVRERYPGDESEELMALENVIGVIDRLRPRNDGTATPSAISSRGASGSSSVSTTQRAQPEISRNVPSIFYGSATHSDPMGTRMTVSARLDLKAGKVSGEMTITLAPGMDITKISGPFDGTYSGTTALGKWSGVMYSTVEGYMEDDNGRRRFTRERANQRIWGDWNGRYLFVKTEGTEMRVELKAE